MPKLIEAYKKNLRLKEDQERERAEKAKALLAEARDYFGYDIDKYDPRFEKMVEEKQEREKSRKEEAKEGRAGRGVISQTYALAGNGKATG